MSKWANRSGVIFFAAMLASSAPHMLGQQRGTGAGAGAGSPSAPSAGSGTRGTSTNPSNNSSRSPNNSLSNGTNTTNNPLEDRPIFLVGKVMFDDGSPVNMDVRIERVCGVSSRTEAHVDNKGRFSFQFGQTLGADIASGDATQGDYGSSRNSNATFASMGGGSKTANSETALWGCELRAAYPGYRSDSISLAGRRTMDDPNIGTIILHRLANVQGTTISLTSALAPKGAQKSYDKGMLAARQGNLEEAEKRLTVATNEYPKYATAWFALGQVQQRQNRLEDARKSYLSAVDADKKYVSPYDQLARLAAQDGKWEDAAGYSKQAIELNPVEFPSSFWYNTVANYNLDKPEEALKSGKALLKVDTAQRYPEVNRLLAEITLNQKDYASAAGYLRTYLTEVPKAKDAEMLKQQLLKIEEANAKLGK